MVPASEPVEIKLYGHQRLYRGDIARYVTRDELTALARGGIGLVVRDAATGADITSSILPEGMSEQ